MKPLLRLSIAMGFMGTTVAIQATPVFTDNFDSYTVGNLAGITQDAAGQGGWRQTSTVATAPVQVTAGGTAQLNSTGQDIYNTFTSAVANNGVNDGTSLYVGLGINVSAAQATGDYFMHLTSTVGNTSLFYSKLFIKSVTGGFELGLSDTASSTPTYGSVLAFNTYYNIAMAVNFIAGAKNDTFAVYVNPTDTSVVGNNTPYVSYTWSNAAAEPTNYVGINFRQGAVGSAATLTVDNLTVSQTFADVPEPSSIAMISLGVGMLAVIGRRKK